MGFPRPNPAARFLVLALTVAFYTLAIATYFNEPQDPSAFTYACAAAGTTYFLIFLFGSDNACTNACFLWWW